MLLFDHLREDYRRYLVPQLKAKARFPRLSAMLTYGFIAICVYRYGRWTRSLPWIASIPFKVLYHLLNVPSELLLGIRISTNCAIGPGLHIGHYGGIIIAGDAGRNLTVAQGVTIGYKGAGRSDRPPRIGDDVYLGAGAMVIGDVSVGDGCIIGANTVVTKDIPPRSRVVSAPVRVTPLDDSGHCAN